MLAAPYVTQIDRCPLVESIKVASADAMMMLCLMLCMMLCMMLETVRD